MIEKFTEDEITLNQAIYKNQIKIIKEQLAKKTRIINDLNLYHLVKKKNNTNILKYIHNNGFDLTGRGGLLMFQAMCSGKFENAIYLLSLIPQGHHALTLSMINLFPASVNYKFEISQDFFDLLMDKIPTDIFNESVLPKFERYSEEQRNLTQKYTTNYYIKKEKEQLNANIKNTQKYNNCKIKKL